MTIVRVLVAAAFGFAASCVLANVEIVDRSLDERDEEVRQNQSRNNLPRTSTYGDDETQSEFDSSSVESASELSYPSTGASNPTAEMFYQMQVMQQEILELRGLVEEQAHQIKRLKQQRLDDYVDLDRRLSTLGSAGSAKLGGESVNPQPASARSGLVSTVDDEQAHYQKAIDPIIGSTKNLELAIGLLHEHLEQFPNGRFVANAQYWLGESYLVNDAFDESKNWFEALLNNYPLHDKVPAAKLKLGIVYHKLGMNAQSRTLLEEVKASGGPAASRASTYLDANF